MDNIFLMGLWCWRNVLTAHLALYICMGTLTAHAQSATSFTHISSAQGLSDNRILDIVQDQYGYMWFGTMNGLNRYDGYGIRRYFAGTQKGNLPSNHVQTLLTQQTGQLIAGTRRGLAMYNYATDNFEPLPPFTDSLLQPLNTAWVTALAQDAYGNLYAGTYSGLFCHHKKSNTWQNLSAQFGYPDSLSDIRSILFIAPDSALIGTQDNPFFLLDMGRQKAERITFTGPFAEQCCHYLRDIERVSQDEVLISFFALGLGRYNFRTGQFAAVAGPLRRSPDIFYNSNYSIKKDSRGIIWTGGFYHGLGIYNPATQEVMRADYDPYDKTGYSGQGIDVIYEDRQQNIWIGTLAHGVYLLKPNQQAVKQYKYDVLRPNGYTNGRVRHIYEGHNEKLYIGGDKGLSIFDRKKGIYTNFTGTRGFVGNQLPEQVNFTFADVQGNIWMGSDRLGMGRLDGNRGTTQQFGDRSPNTIQRMGAVEMQACTMLSDTAYLIVTPFKPVLFNPLRNSYRNEYNDHRPIFQIQDHIPRFFFNRHQGQLYGITRNGLLLQIDTATFQYTQRPLAHILGQQDLVCYALSGNGKGMLAVGTNKGIIIITPTDTLLHEVPTGIDVLNEITGVLVTDTHLWFGNSRVIGRMDNASRQYKLIGKKEGLREDMFFLPSLDTLRNGHVVVGSGSGWYEILPEKLDTTEVLNAPVITHMRINNQPVSHLAESGFKQHITTRYFENNLYFELSALDYVFLEDIEYAYRLVGYNSEWQYTGTQRILNFTNLPGGTYTLMIKARAPGGVWVEGKYPLKIEIALPFWETIWFRLCLALAIALAAYAFYTARIAQVRQREKLRSDFEIKLNELENSALRTQMNPHFIFNSLNTINSFINRNEPTMANQYISKFSRLMRLILDHSREKKISLEEELEVLKLYVQIEQIRFENKFSFEIKLSPEADIYNVQVPPLIIQPFAENAILHGLLPLPDKGQLTLTIQPKHHFIQIIVEDNGVGRSAKKQKAPQRMHRKSHGMDITLKRIELFNKEHNFEAAVHIVDLFYADGSAAGTRVEIPLFAEERF